MEKDVLELKSDALGQVALLKEEYEDLLAKTPSRKKKKSDSKLQRAMKEIGFGAYEDNYLNNFYRKRKDQRYASLVVELYSQVEQLLKDIYKSLTGITYDSKSKVRSKNEFGKDNNIVVDLEIKLREEKVSFLKEEDKLVNIMTLTLLRNHIVHNRYSLKDARDKVDSNRLEGLKEIKNKELYAKLLNCVREYIKQVEAP